MSEFYAEMKRLLSEHGELIRRTDINTGDEALVYDGKAIIGNTGESFLEEKLRAEPVLIMFGAGHVGKALYDLAVLQGMHTIILDDREELLTADRFPLAERYIGSFEILLEKEYHAVSPYFVIFTHGHSYDKECLRYALRHDSSYIGMIGSRRKAGLQLDEMRKEGFAEEKVRAVHSPVGLSINAATPEEIAISIMAEIISVFRHDRNTITIDSNMLEALVQERGIAVRIIEKEGSAPRGEGTMMFVTESNIYSTIGGGAIENIAIEHAREMLRKNSALDIVSYGLGNDGNTGMICGGSLRLLYKYSE